MDFSMNMGLLAALTSGNSMKNLNAGGGAASSAEMTFQSLLSTMIDQNKNGTNLQLFGAMNALIGTNAQENQNANEAMLLQMLGSMTSGLGGTGLNEELFRDFQESQEGMEQDTWAMLQGFLPANMLGNLQASGLNLNPQGLNLDAIMKAAAGGTVSAADLMKMLSETSTGRMPEETLKLLENQLKLAMEDPNGDNKEWISRLQSQIEICKAAITEAETEKISFNTAADEGVGLLNAKPVQENQGQQDQLQPQTAKTMDALSTKENGVLQKNSKVEESTSLESQQESADRLPSLGTPEGATRVETSAEPLKEAASLQPYSQIGKEILSKLEQKGPMEFKLQLEPEHLGKIDIALKMSDGKLVIDILSANTATHSLLVSQVDKLVRNLGMHNVQVETVNVNQNQQTVQPVEQQVATGNQAMMDFADRRQQEQFEQQRQRQWHSSQVVSEQADLSEASVLLQKMRYEAGRMNYVV